MRIKTEPYPLSTKRLPLALPRGFKARQPFRRHFSSAPIVFNHKLINGLSDTPPAIEVPLVPRLINNFKVWLFLKRLFVGNYVLWKTRRSFKSLTIDTTRLDKSVQGPIIFVANHRSDIDPPLVGAILLKQFGFPWFMAKKELWKTAFHRFIYAISASLPIDRNSTDIKGVRPFVSLLKSGKPLVVFLEGFRPHALDIGKELDHNLLYSDIDPATGLLPGKSIALTLALAAGAKIIPVGISGLSRHRNPDYLLGLGPETNPKTIDLKVTFGSAIDVCDFVARRTADKEYRVRKADMEAATNLVMQGISHLVDFSLEYFPHEVPVPEAAIDVMRTLEEKQAQKLEQKGHGELAAIIRARHALHQKPTQ